MSNKNIKKVNFIEVDDWDKLVSETYDKPYSLQQQDDCKSRGIEKFDIPSDYDYDNTDYTNDDMPELINGELMQVSFDKWLARDPNAPLNISDEELENSRYYWGKTPEDAEEYKNDTSHIRMFWQRNFYPCHIKIANDLYAKGLLPKGTLIINIDW